MKHLNASLFAVLFFCATVFYAQDCGTTQTIEICNMTTIDFDSNGQPDGIINLYDEYNKLGLPTPIVTDGTWSDPNFTFALDEATGNLSLWDLGQSSETISQYSFVLVNSKCDASSPFTMNIVLQPFSGFVSGTDSNAQVCTDGIDPTDCSKFARYDLNQAFLPRPSPHTNGTWEFVSTDGDISNLTYSAGSSVFSAVLPYQPGIPLIDKQEYVFRYTVNSVVTGCANSMVTEVKVSVVRDVSAGRASTIAVCEEQIKNGVYDADLNLRDDDYLIREDIEGVWVEDGFQITSPVDSNVNIKAVYDQLLIDKGRRFGYEEVKYKYAVDDISKVCGSKEEDVVFKILEHVRKPSSSTIPEYCIGENHGNIDLYDLIEFQNESGTVFDYPNRRCTNWQLMSKPRPASPDFGLKTNGGNWCDLTDDPGDVQYNYEGKIGLNLATGMVNADAGLYTFRYWISGVYNHPNEDVDNVSYPLNDCTPNTSSGACPNEFVDVQIRILPTNYAGEDTPIATSPALEYCEDDPLFATPLDLTTLLQTNGVDTIFPGGTWTETATGNPVNPYPFVLPTITGSQVFNLTYTTPPTANGCTDESTLEFTVYEKYSSGTLNVSDPYLVCETAAPFSLNSLLQGADTPAGAQWTYQDGTVITTPFDPASSSPGRYTYTVPANGQCPSMSTGVTINIQNLPDPGTPINIVQEICIYDNLTLNLFSFYDNIPADKNGVFVNDPTNQTDITPAISGNILTTSLIPAAGDYKIRYQLTYPPCTMQESVLDFKVYGVPNAGQDYQRATCVNSAPFDLFDNLIGADPTTFTTGKWYDENDVEVAATNNFTFDPSAQPVGTYVYKYKVKESDKCEQEDIAIATINVTPTPNSGDNVSRTLCRSAGIINLEDHLAANADKGGVFVDVDNSGALSGNLLDLSLLANQEYRFDYTADNPAGCTVASSEIRITPIVLQNPTVSPQKFCVIYGKTLADVIVNSSSNYLWYDSPTATVPLLESTVLIADTDYYVANVDDADCESDRIVFRPDLLPLNDKECDPCIPEAVSPNGDGVNDVLDLCGLPYAFPNYSVKIFNRYGTVVFEGGSNKDQFKGESNTGVGIGTQLPTGVYFYVFDPKDGKNKPFQGNFYLSKSK